MTRLLAVCPRIRKDAGRVVASTAWRVRVLLLETIYRRLEVDPTTKTLFIRTRYLWLIRLKRVITFAEVEAVTYGYEDMTIGSYISFAHDSQDWFTVGLRLKDDSEMHLFNFIGDGTFSNHGPFPDWLYWDEIMFDISGSQEKESRVFVELLSRLIGVKVVPPRAY